MSRFFVRTISGKEVDFLNPRPEDFEIDDIAQSLSKLCRFVGQIDCFYSVGQHSVLVSHLCPPQLAQAGLMHDAVESITGDIVHPLKELLGVNMRRIEKRLERAMCQRFYIDFEQLREVKYWDRLAFATENRDLRGIGRQIPGDPLPDPDIQIQPWSSAAAYTEFLRRFDELFVAGSTEMSSIEVCGVAL